MSNPFETLGVPESSTEQEVLKAWRLMALQYHPDKMAAQPDVQSDEHMKAINEAKNLCLDAIIKRNYTANEQEFVHFVCRKLEKSLERNCDLRIDLGDGNLLIRPTLRKFMWMHAVDAMEWVLLCGMGEVEFYQAAEDEIPIICKYYNTFIGETEWCDEDHTFMTVLNKYDQIKASGHGNFGQRLEA